MKLEEMEQSLPILKKFMAKNDYFEFNHDAICACAIEKVPVELLPALEELGWYDENDYLIHC